MQVRNNQRTSTGLEDNCPSLGADLYLLWETGESLCLSYVSLYVGFGRQKSMYSSHYTGTGLDAQARSQNHVTQWESYHLNVCFQRPLQCCDTCCCCRRSHSSLRRRLFLLYDQRCIYFTFTMQMLFILQQLCKPPIPLFSCLFIGEADILVIGHGGSCAMSCGVLGKRPTDTVLWNVLPCYLFCGPTLVQL